MKTLQQIKDEYLEKQYGTVDFSSFYDEDVGEIADQKDMPYRGVNYRLMIL